MNWLAGSWPFSLAPNEFEAVVVVFGAIVTATGVLIAMLIGDMLDGPVTTTHSVGLRAGIATDAPFAVGRLPARADFSFVGWLRRGVTGIADVLYADAVTRGWLRFDDKSGVFHVVADAVDLDAPSRFQELLGGAGVLRGPVVWRTALLAAAGLEPGFRARAVDEGLLRPFERRLLVTVVGALGGGAVLVAVVAYGVARHAATADLMPMALTFVLGGAVGAFVASAEHRQRRAWLTWVSESTHALRADLHDGRLRQQGDLLLGAALFGVRNLGRSGSLLGVDVLAPRPALTRLIRPSAASR